MNNNQVLDLIMQRLGGRSASSLRASVLLELNNKIHELERGPYKPWFLEEELTQADVPLVANQEYIDLPSNFLMEVDENPFYLYDPVALSWKKLVKVNMMQLRDETLSADAAIPDGYALYKKRIYFGPKPDQAYSYKLPYLKRTTDVVDNSSAVSNDWLLEFFNYITLEASVSVALLHVQSQELAQKLSPELQAARRAFEVEVEARKHANMEYLLNNEES